MSTACRSTFDLASVTWANVFQPQSTLMDDLFEARRENVNLSITVAKLEADAELVARILAELVAPAWLVHEVEAGRAEATQADRATVFAEVTRRHPPLRWFTHGAEPSGFDRDRYEAARRTVALLGQAHRGPTRSAKEAGNRL